VQASSWRRLQPHPQARKLRWKPHVAEHTLGTSVPHVYPHSAVHVDEHPSSDTVSPSSHPSPGVLTQSPHTSVHSDLWQSVP
jgi:hypothetical protein